MNSTPSSAPASELRLFLDEMPLGDRLWVMEFFQHLFSQDLPEAEKRWEQAYSGSEVDALEVAFDALRSEVSEYPHICGLGAALDGPAHALDNFLDALARAGKGQGMAALMRLLADDMLTYEAFPQLPEAQVLAHYKALLRRLLVLLNDDAPVPGIYSLSKLALERFEADFSDWTRVHFLELKRDSDRLAEFKEHGSRALAEESLFNPYRSVRMRALLTLERLASELCDHPQDFLERTYNRIVRNCPRKRQRILPKRLAEIQAQSPSLHLPGIEEPDEAKPRIEASAAPQTPAWV
ncbi:MAG: hypothetical protein ACFB21_08600 [Opitutales bacterium]